MVQPSRRQPLVALFCCMLFGLLGGCDGGLFGTDDGSVDASQDIPASPSDLPSEAAPGGSPDGGTGDTPDAAQEPPTNGVQDSPESPDGETDGSTAGTTGGVESPAPGTDAPPTDPGAPPSFQGVGQSFNNALITTPRDDALLTAVNPLERELYLIIEGLAATQVDTVAIPPGGATRHIAVPVGSLVATVSVSTDPDSDGSGDGFALATLDLSLGTGTLTTLVTREENALFDVVPLASVSGSSGPELASVRLLQASALGDPEREADFLMESRGAAGGGAETAFAEVSYRSPGTDYQELPAGDYTLTDPNERFAPQAVSFDGGQSYTVVIRDTDGAVLQIEVDSDLDVR